MRHVRLARVWFSVLGLHDRAGAIGNSMVWCSGLREFAAWQLRLARDDGISQGGTS